MDETIQFLLTLQNYDMRLDELARNLENIPQNIVRLEADIGQRNQRIVQEKTQIQGTKLETQKSEKEMQQIEGEIATARYKLALSKIPKESDILTKKIEDGMDKAAQMEEMLLHKMFELDSKEAEFSILQRTSTEEIQKLRNEQEYQRQLAVDLEKNIIEVQNKIVVMRKILQENCAHWLQHYDRTKKAIHKMPCIVERKPGNFCGGCHLKLSDYNDQTIDSKFPFMICESCARMIVLIPKEEDDFNEIYQKITKYS
ncbi:MAG: hypothetical protein LBQ03_00965 [Puniceicoccales bacterium]|jgi:predicted  nucleic acid-binding Zn-ribbon protein|nr:hypothetical protein [Puniceicoccales bacterium]